MASSSTASIDKSFKYDVFLSFRGDDTRRNFIDHLYHALQQKGIYTYKDDEEIKRGKLISDELIRSIKDSRFYIIVFSKNYASSRWCLNELVEIMECQKMNEHSAYPVFYDVEPTEVRWQIGAVGKAFKKHKNHAATGKWKEALKEAADLAGWELKNTVDGHEAKFIQLIVEVISEDLPSINFCFGEELVGMDTRVKDVISHVETGIDDVSMIGIWGIGGGGKTTLARAVFDHISFRFDGKCFVENVREVSKASLSGLTSLQNKILTNVLNDRNVNVGSVYDGKCMMKQMMRMRKVLIVLDDVNKIEQLKALAGDPRWFGKGSRIIITTRDKHILLAHWVKWVINVNLLSKEEAICLFHKIAFRGEIPIQGHEELSGQVVRYADGLPLTIRVLGSFLCDKNESEWIDALERLKNIPLEETLQILELSYNDLEEDYKEIFLTVACILKGWSKELAIEALESCGFRATIGLRVLEERSLISYIVSRGLNLVVMHDHIVEMGRNFVRRVHPDKPKKHSRLWIDEEIQHIFANDLGTKATRFIRFHLGEFNLEIVMKGLRKMKELRFLHVSGENDVLENRDYDHNVNQSFPNSLQYLHWYKYPLLSLPNTFQGDNLVALKMSCSKLVRLWEGGEIKVLKKLKFLDLSHSEVTALNLELTPNLEQLCLEGCCDLVELHLPYGCQKLTQLHCTESKLKTLDLQLALNLDTLILHKSKDLVRLQMPDKCQKLISLDISHSKLIRSLDLGLTPNLKSLNIEECNNLEQLHAGCLQNIVQLFLPVCLRFKSFVFEGASRRSDESPEVGPLAELHLKTKYLEKCPLHPDSTLRKFQFECFYKDDPSLTRNAEKLVSVGLCACTNIEKFSGNICGLERLRKLEIEGYPQALMDLGQLECLEQLSLSRTNMRHLSDSIGMLKHLKSLDLNFFYLLEKLPEGLGGLEGLETLTLSYIMIKQLPDSICKLKHLKDLKLVHCSLLEKLPEDLGRLECLEDLQLSYAMIRHLPDSICKLKHLKYLKLDQCSLLEKLPEGIGQLNCLVSLSLSSLKIKHLPGTICMLKNLLGLYLYGCSSLETLPEDLDRLERVKTLDLSGCKSLRDIPVNICKMKRLERLDVSGTCLSHLPQDIFLLIGLYIIGPKDLFESSGLYSTRMWEDVWHVIV